MTSNKKKRQPLRALRLWWLRLNRKQRSNTVAIERNDEAHTCCHCGSEYHGSYCPQCSMPASWHRFDFRQMINNFLDIWGFGNRSMYRSLKDLLWRPGYMIRDYLAGHYLYYFPPFKMLAILITLFVAIAYVFNIPNEQSFSLYDFTQYIEKTINDSSEISNSSTVVWQYIKNVAQYLDKHILYSIILQNIVVVFVIWLLFRRKTKYSFIEIFYSQIYINCQFVLLSIIIMLLTWKVPQPEIYPYAVPLWLVTLFLLIDFKQFYQLSWWQTIWRTAVVPFIIVFIYLFLLTLTIVLYLVSFATI